MPDYHIFYDFPPELVLCIFSRIHLAPVKRQYHPIVRALLPGFVKAQNWLGLNALREFCSGLATHDVEVTVVTKPHIRRDAPPFTPANVVQRYYEDEETVEVTLDFVDIDGGSDIRIQRTHISTPIAFPKIPAKYAQMVPFRMPLPDFSNEGSVTFMNGMVYETVSMERSADSFWHQPKTHSRDAVFDGMNYESRVEIRTTLNRFQGAEPPYDRTLRMVQLYCKPGTEHGGSREYTCERAGVIAMRLGHTNWVCVFTTPTFMQCENLKDTTVRFFHASGKILKQPHLVFNVDYLKYLRPFHNLRFLM